MKAVLILSLLLGFSAPSLYANPPCFAAKDTCSIPTLITPNDDGQNDVLIIPCLPKTIVAYIHAVIMVGDNLAMI